MMQRRAEENAQLPEIEPDSSVQLITEDQHRQLEARIEELGLDRDRVKNWMIKASKKRFADFEELDPEFYQVLYRKLDQFARSAQ
jgi:TolA-binding protein